MFNEVGQHQFDMFTETIVNGHQPKDTLLTFFLNF